VKILPVTWDTFLKFEHRTPSQGHLGPGSNSVSSSMRVYVSSYKGTHTEPNSCTFPLLLHYGWWVRIEGVRKGLSPYK